MESIYLETSFFSYLTARISNNLVSAARQQITNEWWENNFNKYNLYISDFVIAEASKGDMKAAEKRKTRPSKGRELPAVPPILASQMAHFFPTAN